MKNKRLFILLLIIPIIIFFIGRSFSLPDDEEEEEPELDNWEISTVFYDSTVDNGNTPLTEINWDASDGGYGQGETRIITVQITYKNTNTMYDYAPNDVKIEVDNLVYGTYAQPQNQYEDSPITSGFMNSAVNYRVLLGANDGTHTEYDWNYEVQNYTPDGFDIGFKEKLIFYNKNRIDKNTNFEGDIQIRYELVPKREETNFSNIYNRMSEKLFPIEPGEDECTHDFEKYLSSSINVKKGNNYDQLLASNEIKYSYTRKYVHPWIKVPYQIQKTADSLPIPESLPSNFDDYIWVKYSFKIVSNEYPISSVIYNYYPHYFAGSFRVEEEFENAIVVLNSSYQSIEKTDNKYLIDVATQPYSSISANGYGNDYIIVGYPKNIYNGENLQVSNTAKLYARYLGSNQYEYQDDDTINIDLKNFNFNFSGDYYVLDKQLYGSNTYHYGSDGRYYTQTFKGQINGIGYDNIHYSLPIEIINPGKNLDVIFGDDILFITDKNGNNRVLEDDEYHFSSVNNLVFHSSTGDLYDQEIKLYVRHANQSNYELYGTYDNYYREIYFNTKDIVAWYVEINNLSHSILCERRKIVDSDYNRTNNVQANVVINNAHDIAENGKVYNFDYLKVYENGVLLNPSNAGLYELYSSLVEFPEEFAKDGNNYIQRDYISLRYSPYEMQKPIYHVYASKEMTDFVQNASEEKFTGTATIGAEIIGGISIPLETYLDLYDGDKFDYDDGITRIEIYDLLPEGLELTSSTTDIINSIKVGYYSEIQRKWNYNEEMYDINMHNLSREELVSIMKENATIDVIENWNNTNRTYIRIIIDLSNNPLYSLSVETNVIRDLVYVEYDYSISYNSYLEYGDAYKNTTYALLFGNIQERNNCSYNDGLDLNMDGSIDCFTYYEKESITKKIVSIISTNQDVQTSVQSDLSNYNIGTINSSRNSNYTYKLRVRTGSNDITNLVIYNSIEDYAKNPQLEIVKASGGKQYWQGEFLGIDTSYAESKGYTVKTYYNENPKPGSLSEDDSWHEYTNEVDKTKVKSLAFKYLDSNGNPAVLPANSLTYVLISMKSPDEDYIAYAYNGCWTEWNAIDPITERPVDFITGINSNIVKVALPRSRDVEDIQLTLTKEWKDGSNALNTRPNEVKFNLISNGDTSNANEVTITGTGNEWSVNVQAPELDNLGNEIEYSVTENLINTIDGYKYIETINGLTITNTLYKDITLKKEWKDNSDLYLTRPENVTYKVKQNGNDYQEVTFNGNLTSDEWTKVITVPVFDNNGNEYTYTVDEVEIDNYSKSCEGLTCTNTLTGNENITIKKIWIDSDNEYNTRPSSIDIKLKQNGNDYQTVHLTGNSNIWESSEITIPKYDSNGVKYTYSISENQLDDYGLVVYDQANYQVTNTLKKNISIVVTKKWVDGSNEQGIRPDELKINLLRNNEQYQELTLTGDSDTWTTTIEVPKYDDDQKEYVYSIKEITDDLNSDYSNITYGEDLSVTNKLEKKKNIQVSKIWDDSNNKYLTRPDKVNVNLLRNGEIYREIELSNSSEWKKEVNDLDVYDNTGKLYKYTIEEKEQLVRYESVTYDQTSFTINNKLTIIPKVTLYFTVKNGYLDSNSGDLKFDQEGLNRVMNMHKLNTDTAYEYDFELENVDTGEIKKAKLSTEGTLKFEDIPYGTYRARESEDKYFKFVDMVEIENVSGVTFTEDDMGGTITISPTGKDIIYGTNTTNRIEPITPTPITSANRNYIIVYLLLIIGIFIGLYYYKKKA